MKKNLIKWLGSTVAVLTIASTANATVEDAIRYSTDGSSWTTVNGTGTGSITTGSVTVGGFTFVIVTSLTKPAVGSAAAPQMDLGVSGVSGVGTLYVEFSAIDFTPVPSGSYVTTFGPNNGSGVTETETSTVGANTLFAGGTTVASFPATQAGTLTASGTAPGQPNPYSITIEDIFTSTARGSTVSDDDKLITVPDGGSTMMLLGSALSVLGLGVFRNSRKSAVARA